MDDYLDDEAGQGGGFDPSDILRMFLRRKWLFLVPFALCLGMAYVAIKTMAPVYESSGELRVIQNQTVTRSLNETTPRYTHSRNPDNETEVLIRTVVTSPKFLERLVRDLNLQHSGLAGTGAGVFADGTVPDEDQHIASLVTRLQRWIRVRTEDSHIFSIGVRHNNPQLVTLLAPAILKSFLAEEQASRQSRVRTELEFLNGQRDANETALQDAQQALADFQRSLLSTNLAGNPINEGNIGMADVVVARLRDQALSGVEGNLVSLHAEARRILPAVDQFLEEIVNDPEVVAAVRELTDLEYARAVAEMSGGDTDLNQSQLGSTRLNLDGLVEVRVADEYGGLDLVSQSRVTRYLFARINGDADADVADRLEGQIGTYRNFMTRQPEQSATLSRLQREVESAQEALQTTIEDIRRVTTSLAATMTEIGYRMEIYSEPGPALYPVEPDKKKLAMMGFALAAAIGVALVVLAEMLDRSFKSVLQIERSLGVKVIGTLPMVKDGPFEERRRRSFFLWAGIIVAIAAVAAIGLLWVYPRISG